jgi:hypothetical protein
VSWSSLIEASPVKRVEIDVSLSDANADLQLALDNHKALVMSLKHRRQFL